jgi:hypothetical protein
LGCWYLLNIGNPILQVDAICEGLLLQLGQQETLGQGSGQSQRAKTFS